MFKPRPIREDKEFGGVAETNVHVSIGPWGVGNWQVRVDKPAVPMVQGQDVDAEDLSR